MDFYEDYKNYQKEKNKKYNIKKYIKKNNVFFGSGGSSNIIIKIDNKKVIKVIPEFNKEPNLKMIQDNDIKEINFYKIFFNEFIKPSITPHIVGYYNNYKLINISTIFPKKCLTMDQKLLIKPEKMNYINDKLCELKNLYKFKVLKETADIIVLENCDTTIENEIIKILTSKMRNKYDLLEDLLNRIIFQLIYTLTVIQDKYPTFIHNDLFLRNVLGRMEDKYESNDYIEYIYNNESYYFKANGFCLKLNDFGYSLMPPIVVSKVYYEKIKFNPILSMTYDDNLRDIYTFLYDLYDGENFGHTSVMKLLENANTNSKVVNRIRNIFKKYFDVNVIDKIIKNNKYLLDGQWNIKHIPLLRKTVMEPKMYFKKGKFNDYKKIPSKNENIVITFEIK